MLMNLFPSNSKTPQEREYEGWIVREMEDYFKDRGYEVLVYALSPHEEKIFSADDVFKIHNGSFKRAFALQFKRPYRKNMSKPQDIYWERDLTQDSKIQAMNGIYYCLPTFTNRKSKLAGLHHSMFWRPDWAHVWGECVDVSSSRISRRVGCLAVVTPGPKKSYRSTALRFGAFVEALEIRTLGVAKAAFESLLNDLFSVNEEVKAFNKTPGNAQSLDLNDLTTYLFVLTISRQ